MTLSATDRSRPRPLGLPDSTADAGSCSGRGGARDVSVGHRLAAATGPPQVDVGSLRVGKDKDAVRTFVHPARSEAAVRMGKADGVHDSGESASAGRIESRRAQETVGLTVHADVVADKAAHG